MSVPQVSARVFALCLLLAFLALATVMTKSVAADVMLFGLGAVATTYVLYTLGRGRA